MTKPSRIDFVADISCPFCAIAVASLSEALVNIDDTATFNLHFQPYELNPQMPSQGQDFLDYLSVKSGTAREQVQVRLASLTQRGAEVGFSIDIGEGSRIYNTFDAHRLLYWASFEGNQHALKQRLLAAYFSEGSDISNVEVLVDAASSVGLGAETARRVLASRQYAQDVRKVEEHWKTRGVTSVPSIFINGDLVFTSAQTVATFETALRNLSRSA